MTDIFPEEGGSPQITPHSRASEEAVLGSVLINPDCLDNVALQSDEFFVRRHSWIWDAFKDLEVIDFLTVQEKLESMGRLGDVGGPAYLTALLSNVPTSLHVDAYAKIVRDMANRRAGIAIASKVVRAAYDETEPFMPAIYAAEMVGSGRATSQTRTADIIGIEFIDTVDEDHRTIPSGVPAYDNLIGYLEREMLNIWGGRPGMGKTSGAVQIARNVAAAGNKATIFALEGSETSLWARIACAEVGVTWLDLKAGRLSDHQINEVKAASGRMAGVYHGNLIIDAEARDIGDIWRGIAENRPDVVVLDHIGLVDPMHENDIHSLGFISKECKQMAKRFDCHFILICQLNRSPDNRDDKRPIKKDLRGSGKIEQNADLITMMYRDDYYEDKEYWNYTAEWNVIKNRDGPTGRAHLTWQPEKLWFGGVR